MLNELTVSILRKTVAESDVLKLKRVASDSIIPRGAGLDLAGMNLPLEKRACNGSCKCAKGTKRGQYCGMCEYCCPFLLPIHAPFLELEWMRAYRLTSLLTFLDTGSQVLYSGSGFNYANDIFEYAYPTLFMYRNLLTPNFSLP